MKEFKLPQLPYAKDALKPFLSAETFEFHHGKHHKAYIDKMNVMLKDDAKWSSVESLEELVKKTEGPLFNQAGQAWNHTFFWYSMSPTTSNPDSSLKTALEKSFSSVEEFKKKFVEQGVGVFGSGWIWLVKNSSGGLELMGTSNAENPIRHGNTPLLVCDVWEHAYYVDFRNDRKGFLEKFLNHVNWSFVAANYASNDLANMTKYMI